MKIPFVGPSYQARSLGVDSQRSVNCYLEFDNGSPAAPVALYGTPGLVLQLTLPTSPNRGCIASGDYWYFVAGNTVYRIDSVYTVTTVGTIGTTTGRIGFATNGTEVLIVDGVSGWLVTGTVITQITDADFPNGVTSAAYLGTFFIVTGDSTQKLYWNETPNAGSAWNGLDFASAEGSPDGTKAVVTNSRELWPFGSESAEIWLQTTDADQIFQPSGNAFLEQGTASAWTVQSMDNSVFWLGSGKAGNGMVFRAQGYTPVRISTHAVETAIRAYSTVSDAFAWCWQIEGHSFYVLTFPTADATWLYDAATNEWTEWLWRDPATNRFHRHRAACYAFANGKHLVGDWETGKVYRLEIDTYTDAGDAIRRLRRTQTFSEDGEKLFFGELDIAMETGVGLATGQGSNPLLMLRYSNDGGRTWSNEKTKGIGGPGEYRKRVKFGPTGMGTHRSWEISMTDPVKFAVFGAAVAVTKGTS